MTRRPVLVAGCGYTGAVLAHELAEAGVPVWGLRSRSPEVPVGVRGIQADVADGKGLAEALAPLQGQLVDVVFLLAPGGRRDEEGYRATYLHGLEALGEVLTIGRLVYASSTGVYGDLDGWVDEATPPRPARFSGEVLLEAEARTAELAQSATVVRFGGIYGPDRDRTVRKIADGEAIVADGVEAYGNRIHRDDVAGVCRWCLEHEAPRGLYVGVDRAPAPLAEVQRWLCEQLDRDPASLRSASPRARGGSKRCRSERLVEDGYRFRVPSYREGYAELIRARR